MEKSLSLKLAARKHTRYLTYMAVLVLIVMIGSMLIKNPSGGKAAVLMTQTLPINMDRASAILNPTNNTTYLIGGYNTTASSYSREIYTVDMSFATNPTSAGVSGYTGSLCLQAAGAASVFNPITQRAYLIGGGNSTGNRIKTIAEVDLSDPNKVIEDGDIKCTVVPSTGNPPLNTNLLSVVDAISGSGDYNSFTERAKISVFINQQTIYLIGGSSGDYSLNDIFEDVYELDTSNPGNLTIKKITSTISGQQLLHLRRDYSVAFDPVINKAFLFGGRKCVNPHTVSGNLTCDNIMYDTNLSNAKYLSPNNDILVFDLTAKTISNLTFDSSAFPPTVPSRTLFDPVNRMAYITWGYISPNNFAIRNLNYVLKFNTQNNTISNTGKETPPIYTSSAVLNNGKIYSFGGSNYDRGFNYLTSKQYVNTIYMTDMSQPNSDIANNNFKIDKRLLPKYRNGISDETYNPYALQNNDIIKVQIDISGASPGSTLTIYDDALNTKGGNGTVKCDPNDADALALGSPSPGWTMVDNIYGWKTFVWSTTADSSGNKQLIYYCKVKE